MKNNDNLHQQTISWLVSNLKGAKENHSARQLDFDGFYPDIIVMDKNNPIELHEVQVTNIRELPCGIKRILWLVLPSVWEEIHCILAPFTKEDAIIKMVDIENKLRMNIKELEDRKRRLSEKVDALRKIQAKLLVNA